MCQILHVFLFAIHRHDLTAGFRTARGSLETVSNIERGERGGTVVLLKWPTNHRPPAFFSTRGGGLRNGGDREGSPYRDCRDRVRRLSRVKGFEIRRIVREPGKQLFLSDRPVDANSWLHERPAQSPREAR